MERYRDRLRLTQLDLLDDKWVERVAGPVGAVVSTWALHDLGSFKVLDSYHCSRYNTNTGRLTEEMFDAIFATARELLDNMQ